MSTPSQKKKFAHGNHGPPARGSVGVERVARAEREAAAPESMVSGALDADRNSGYVVEMVV